MSDGATPNIPWNKIVFFIRRQFILLFDEGLPLGKNQTV